MGKNTLFIHVHGSQLTAPANSGDRDLEILLHAGVEQGREENLQQEEVKNNELKTSRVCVCVCKSCARLLYYRYCKELPT